MQFEKKIQSFKNVSFQTLILIKIKSDKSYVMIIYFKDRIKKKFRRILSFFRIKKNQYKESILMLDKVQCD